MKEFEAKILKLEAERVAIENKRSNEEPGSGMDWASEVAGTLHNSAGTKTGSVNEGRVNVLESIGTSQTAIKVEKCFDFWSEKIDKIKKIKF